MPQVLDAPLKYVALGWIQFETGFFEFVEHRFKSFQLFTIGSAVNDNFFQVDQAEGEVQFSHASLHQCLECSWSIHKAKKHTVTLKKKTAVPL